MVNNSKNSCERVDVLVAGYGPAGAALAALLGKFGIKTLVIDKADDVLMMPRAIALDNEALRILQMVGLDENSFDRIGIQEVKMRSPYMGEFGRVNTSGTIDGHPKLVTFYQPGLERALRKQVTRFANVDVRLSCELMSLEQNKAGVTARIKGQDSEEFTVQASYLVGADGASSMVRGIIGQEFEGESYTEDWLIVDADQREGKAIDHVEFICDPRRPTPHMPAPGGRERWEFMMHPGESREEMEKPEKLAELLSPWIKKEDLIIERQAVYRFHARCCDSFQNQNVFLVGDAAHITPPFVGQGLVAGLRDVANLSWKLAWVLGKKAGRQTLNSYDEERRPHAKEMINLAKLMGKFVMPRSAPRAILIHGVMKLIRFIPFARGYFEDLKVKPMNRFRSGLFASGNSRKKFVRGGQFPQDVVRIPSGICLSDDVLGNELTLVGIGVDPFAALAENDREQWQSVGGQFVQFGAKAQVHSDQTRFAEILGNDLVLNAREGWLVVVRPDRVVMNDGEPKEAARLISDSVRMLLN